MTILDTNIAAIERLAERYWGAEMVPVPRAEFDMFRRLAVLGSCVMAQAEVTPEERKFAASVATAVRGLHTRPRPFLISRNDHEVP
jgi:hypothetical protein